MLDWIKEHGTLIGLLIAVLSLLIAIFTIPVPKWYEDADGDKFGNPSRAISWIWQPENYVEDDSDCYDANPDAKPGSTQYFSSDRGDGSFDYDCDGKSERALTNTGSCSNGTANQGWNSTVPECGETGDWLLLC